MCILEARRSRGTISTFPGIRRLSSRCCHIIHTYTLCCTRISRFLLTHARICYLADLSIGNSCVKGGIARPRRLRLEIQFWTLGRGLSSIFIRDELSFWQIPWLTVARKEYVSRKVYGLSMSAHVSSIRDKSVFFSPSNSQCGWKDLRNRMQKFSAMHFYSGSRSCSIIKYLVTRIFSNFELHQYNHDRDALLRCWLNFKTYFT